MRKVVILAGIVITTFGMFGVTTVRAASPIDGCTTFGCIKCIYAGNDANACKGLGPKSHPIADTKTAG